MRRGDKSSYTAEQSARRAVFARHGQPLDRGRMSGRRARQAPP